METTLTASIDNVRLWTGGVPVEEAARAQIANLAGLPILGGPVAIMPDVHVGKGATVGSVIATTGAIIPAAVGVDIGCGMVAMQNDVDGERASAIAGEDPFADRTRRSGRVRRARAAPSRNRCR